MPRKTIVFVSAIVLLFVLVAFAVLGFHYPLGNVGKIYTVGVSVFEDENCTTRLTLINWSYVWPGSQNHRMIHLKNNGIATITLSMYSGNWTHAEAGEYLSLSWSHENTTMVADEILMATLTLDVAVNVTESMGFAFDITIVGTGV